MGRKAKEYNKEELINNLKHKYEELGRIPKAKDMLNPNSSAYKRTFGTWKSALNESGLYKIISDKNQKNILENILEKSKIKIKYSKCICCGQPSDGLIMKGNEVRGSFCKNCSKGKLIVLSKGQRFEYFKD